MMFSVVVILLLAAVAYFHYTQGLFSSILSAALAAIAAVLAFSYHETLVDMIPGGRMADQAYGLSLVVLFTVIYLILRVIFDQFVPGNVRVPALADKIGGALFGIVAGVFGVGILVIATQTLPFGASIVDYSRGKLASQREIKLPTAGQARDTYVYDELLEPYEAQALIVPVDEMVVNLVARLSDGGSLAGAQSLKSAHPPFKDSGASSGY
ncbi:MAG: CvpA family protein, partial [Tepidisphaeraceae bacterium]